MYYLKSLWNAREGSQPGTAWASIPEPNEPPWHSTYKMYYVNSLGGKVWETMVPGGKSQAAPPIPRKAPLAADWLA